jgi:hypothetical protein
MVNLQLKNIVSQFLFPLHRNMIPSMPQYIEI